MRLDVFVHSYRFAFECLQQQLLHGYVSAACIIRFFMIAARLAQAQTVRAVYEQ
jgi:hypothetical protein